MNSVPKVSVLGFFLFNIFLFPTYLDTGLIYSKTFIVNELSSKDGYYNQTSYNNCDFLNLCKNADIHINDVTSTIYNKVIDISYLNVDVNLPFP